MYSNVVGVILKLTVDKFVDHINAPTTYRGEIFEVQNVEVAHMTLTMPT